jgi:ABC-type transport system involved in cytochrome bd biosynthesis fused ATPase/permease subunit
MAGQLGFATALAVLIITPEFFLPLRQLAVRYHGGAAGRTAAERLLAILERAPATGAREAGPEPPEPPDPPEADEAPEADETSAVPAAGATIPGPTETRAIRFEDVWFEHLLGSPVLRGLDLELAPGRLVALVGPSGAGKSTLLSLLLRFADPSRGHIRVGDVDLADLDPDAWRSGLSWLPQRPHLGSGSIGEAIALARPEAGQSEVVAAASLAGADEFIDRLPAGYESPIGEGGIRLSGGQRQRVALARAFLRDGPVWLLDEPTAHVDIATEARILEAVRGRVPGRIVLVATHRRGLIEAADQVVLLGAGRALVEHPGPRFERMRPPGHAPVGSHAAPPGAQRP